MSTPRYAERVDTAANWTSANPTLGDGEPGNESDTGRRKLGDGATAWNSLAYVVPFPIGAFYTQYPNAASNTLATAFPSSQEPATLWGGTWALKWDSDGVFFRTEGDNGYSDVTGGRSSGLQRDQGQKITGQITIISNDATRVGILAFESGALSRTGEDAPGLLDSSATGVTSRPQSLSFDSADSPDSRASATTAGETRPTNRLFRIWQRTA